MTRSIDPLFPLFRSRLMTDVVTMIYASDTGHTIQDLSDALGVDRKNVTTIVDRLTHAGVFRTSQVGRSRLIQANEQAPFFEPLSQLLTIVQGPPRVVQGALEGIQDVEAAYIYGSWAARAKGKPGPAPKDVDVLVVTSRRPTPRVRVTILEALDEAAAVLRHPVNPTFATAEQWATSADPFLEDIRRGDLVDASPLQRRDAA